MVGSRVIISGRRGHSRSECSVNVTESRVAKLVQSALCKRQYRDIDEIDRESELIGLTKEKYMLRKKVRGGAFKDL